MNIEIELKLYNIIKHAPSYQIILNDEIVYDRASNFDSVDMIHLDNIQLSDINTLLIKHHLKHTSWTTGLADVAIELKRIKFDGVLLNNNTMFDQTFTPAPIHNIEPMVQNCYFGCNGIWAISFPQKYDAWLIKPYYDEDFGI